MKTISLHKPGEFRLIQTSDLDPPRPTEATVKIKRIGICGTDYHAFKGNQPFFSYPRVLGHELGAEVVALGSNQWAPQLMVGDRVAIEPYLNCNTCQACRSGRSNCCENLRVLGVHTDGGMTEYLNVPIEKLHKSSLLSFEQLALVETLGIGLHAVNRATAGPTDKVLIIGAGPIGLSVAQFCQLNGAFVTVADRDEKRLKFIDRHALANQCMLVTDALETEQLRTYFDGDLPTLIFDATGNQASMSATFNLIAQGGKIVFVGLFQGDVTFNDPNFHRREINVLSSRNSLPADFKTIIALMEEERIDTNPWLSHRTGFDKLPETFATFLQSDEVLIKAMIEL